MALNISQISQTNDQTCSRKCGFHCNRNFSEFRQNEVTIHFSKLNNFEKKEFIYIEITFSELLLRIY